MSLLFTIWSVYIKVVIIDLLTIGSLLGLCNILLNIVPLIQQKINNQKYIAEISIDVYEDVIKLMDDLISTCFADYLYMNGFVGVDYITENDEKEICRNVATLLHERLSPSTVDKISLIYAREQIYDILAEKIYIAVSSFVIEINSHKK